MLEKNKKQGGKAKAEEKTIETASVRTVKQKKKREEKV